ncbi:MULTISPECIES: HXXEE domain-containing protein [Paenibacillus]|uniref:HXXEE domain-containing protein n=1 Tax=Paenibacillus TaxID=44249 RepID=UPI002FE17DAC
MSLLPFLNEHIQLVSLFWLFPVTFLFHDFEELLTVEKWATRHRDHLDDTLPDFFKKILGSSLRMNTLHFAKDVFAVYTIIVVATGLAVFFHVYLLFLAALHLYFLHVFTHVGQALYLKKYTPGVITAVFPVLPYSLYAYYRLLSEGVVGLGDLIWALILMLIIVPVALFLLIRGRNRYAG